MCEVTIMFLASYPVYSHTPSWHVSKSMSAWLMWRFLVRVTLVLYLANWWHFCHVHAAWVWKNWSCLVCWDMMVLISSDVSWWCSWTLVIQFLTDVASQLWFILPPYCLSCLRWDWFENVYWLDVFLVVWVLEPLWIMSSWLHLRPWLGLWATTNLLITLTMDNLLVVGLETTCSCVALLLVT